MLAEDLILVTRRDGAGRGFPSRFRSFPQVRAEPRDAGLDARGDDARVSDSRWRNGAGRSDTVPMIG